MIQIIVLQIRLLTGTMEIAFPRTNDSSILTTTEAAFILIQKSHHKIQTKKMILVKQKLNSNKLSSELNLAYPFHERLHVRARRLRKNRNAFSPSFTTVQIMQKTTIPLKTRVSLIYKHKKIVSRFCHTNYAFLKLK